MRGKGKGEGMRGEEGRRRKGREEGRRGRGGKRREGRGGLTGNVAEDF